MEKIIAQIVFTAIILYCLYVLYEIFVVNPRDRKKLNQKQVNKIDNVLNKFARKKPRCLNYFDIEEAPSDIKNNWVQGPEFLSKLIKCKCGETALNVYASSSKEMLLAPIFIECPKCLSKHLIFDPTVHGWDGENGDDVSLVGENEPRLVNNIPRRVIVDYSYQGPDNYAELIEGGIKNPEDYFDVFIVSTVNDSGGLEEVVSYECS